VLSPGIPHTFPKPHPIAERARKADAKIVCDVDLLGRAQRDAVYVGITGTNGKSTTTALIAHILKSAGRKLEVGGNLGPPVMDFEPLGKDGIYVLEMSSYQLERTCSIKFDVAVLLNVSPNHIDRHGDLAGYVAAKKRIFARNGKQQTAVVGVDDDETRRVADEIAERMRVVRGTREAPGMGMVGAEGTKLVDRSEGAARVVLDMKDAPDLPGRHNAQNAAAAYAAMRALGVAPDVIAAAMKTYRSLPHRLERVAVIDGITYVNDSKATSPEATVWALTSYDRVIWIAGGLSKEVGYDALIPYLPKIAHAILVGKAAAEIAAFLDRHKIPHTTAETIERAVPAAHAKAKAEKTAKVVLLSPACASFDQYRSFEKRGDDFRAQVKKLGGAA
jgi:UDP-N-acetylmuramoylalanine--D-glutamate ligase